MIATEPSQVSSLPLATLLHPLTGQACVALAQAFFESDASPAIVARECEGTRVWVWSTQPGVEIPVQADEAPARARFAPGDMVRHLRSGGDYRVLYWAHTADSRRLPVCVYQSLQDARIWIRSLGAMFDGRFALAAEARPLPVGHHDWTFELHGTKARVTWPLSSPKGDFILMDVLEHGSAPFGRGDAALAQQVFDTLKDRFKGAVPVVVMRTAEPDAANAWCACMPAGRRLTYHFCGLGDLAGILGLRSADILALLPHVAALQE